LAEITVNAKNGEIFENKIRILYSWMDRKGDLGAGENRRG
jgi:hypothetical protein